MKQFYLIIVLIFSAGVTAAQTFQFQVRVDELYSGAPAQHTWKFQTKVGSQSNHSTINECWGVDDTNNNRWFSDGIYNYTADRYYSSDPNYYYRMIRSGTVSNGTLFKFVFQGYEHDEYGRCSEADSYICGWSGWDDGRYQFALNYNNLGGVAPGSWKQVEYSFCDGFYGARLSYNLAPPKINSVLLSKDGNTAETNYCQGGNIVLKVTDNGPGVVEHNDIEYVWQYNLDGDGYEDPYTCEEWDYSNCQGEITEDCMYCMRRPWILNWRDAVVSNSKTANFTLPYTGSYAFRVIMRNKTTGKIGYDYSNPTPTIVAYNPPPVLSDLPADADLVLDNVAEKDYSSNSIEINHVTCRGASTGVIKIKNITGYYGSYYYTLRKTDGTLTLNINGNNVGTPSAGDPVVFPTEAFNKGDLTGLPAGQYELYLENFDDPNGAGDAQRLCYNMYYIYIKQPATTVDASFLPVAKGNGNPYPISCNGASDGTVSATGSGGVGPYTYYLTGFDSQGGAGSVNFTGLSAAGSYTLVAQDAFSCPSPNRIVQNLAQPKLLSVGAPQYEYFGDQSQYNISCHGQTGQVTLYTSGDEAMTRRIQVVNGPADNDVANDSDPAIFAMTAGTYSVVASYQSGCSTAPVPVTLVEPSALAAAIQSAQPASCLPGKGSNDSDGYITLQISGGIPKASGQYANHLTISPQTVINGAQPMFSGLSSGSYGVVIEDAHCSHTVTNIVVPVNPNAVAFQGLAQITEPSCNDYDDGKITVAGKGGFPFSTSLYEFSIEGIKKSGRYASTTFDYGITRGTYKLTIEDSKGCWSDTTVLLAEPLPLTGILNSTPNTCRGDQVAQITAGLSGGTGPYTVQWLTEGDQVLNAETVSSSTTTAGLAAGTYRLQIKDSRGCANNIASEWYTIPRTITDPETLTLSVFSFEHISCYAANDGYVSLAANGGWSSYTYSSDNVTFKTPAEFDGLLPGGHNFFVRDALGCTVSVPHTVDEPAVLTASLQAVKDAQCFDFTNGSIQLTIAGGTTPYSVTAGGQPWIEGNEVPGLRAGTYTVAVRDAHGCPQSVVATVNHPALLALREVETISSSCGSANGQGTVIAAGGITPYQYRWYNGDGELSASEATAVNLLSGSYRVVVEDENHCDTEIPVAVSDVGGANINTWDITTATCSYSLDGAIDITITEGTPPFQISWTNGKDTEDIMGLPSGDYQVRIRDSNNCQLFRTFTVPAPQPLDVAIVDSQPPTCFGSSDAFLEVAFAGGNGGYSYQWVSGATGTRLENLPAGDYGIRLSDNKGCEYQEVISLLDPPKLMLGLEDKTVCVGQVHRVVLPVEGGVYQWTSTNGFTSDQREVSLTQGGVYSAHVVDVKGCIADGTFELKTSTDLLKAELLIAQKAYAGDTVVVIDISWPLPEGITWEFDLANTQVISQDQNIAQMIFPQAGVFPVGVEVALGDCRDKNIQYITILGEEESTVGRVASEPLVTSFTIYPNPNGGNFFIKIVLRDPVPARVRMLNLMGNSSLIDHRMNEQLEYEYHASLESIPSGVYFIVLEVAGETITKRVIIR
jgi:hypothetical protein